MGNSGKGSEAGPVLRTSPKYAAPLSLVLPQQGGGECGPGAQDDGTRQAVTASQKQVSRMHVLQACLAWLARRPCLALHATKCNSSAPLPQPRLQ